LFPFREQVLFRCQCSCPQYDRVKFSNTRLKLSEVVSKGYLSPIGSNSSILVVVVELYLIVQSKPRASRKRNQTKEVATVGHWADATSSVTSSQGPAFASRLVQLDVGVRVAKMSRYERSPIEHPGRTSVRTEWNGKIRRASPPANR